MFSFRLTIFLLIEARLIVEKHYMEISTNDILIDIFQHQTAEKNNERRNTTKFKRFERRM